MPRLRILAGPSTEELRPVAANSNIPVEIKSAAFEGKLLVYIKGFADPSGKVGDSPYFTKRTNVTWSIQVQGRFLRQYSADDILFGNTFQKPLKLPWGFSAALKFMDYIDPTLEQDLASSSKPWALSPLVATMPYLEHRRLQNPDEQPAFPPEGVIGNDMSHIRFAHDAPSEREQKEIAENRRAFLKDPTHRKQLILGPEDLLTADFCYNYLRFSPNGVDLRLPGGITIDMLKYWDGQPVRFVCCERAAKGELVNGEPWGRVLWCVVIELVEDDDDAETK